MKRKDTVYCDDRTFETVTVMEAGFHGEMATVHIYEVVRPTARFFRTRWLDSKSFWISDFPTIDDGVLRMVERVVNKERADAATREKWNDFLNN